MNFLQTIKNSIYNPTFYRTIPTSSFGTAIGYYFLLSLLVTLLQVAFLAFPIASGVHSLTQTMTKEAVNAYPADLTIKLHNGIASVNKPQPYIIPMCDDRNTCETIVIDTRNEQTSNYFSKPDTLVVLTKNAVFLKDNNGQIRGYTLDRFNDFTLNRQTIANFIHQLSPLFPFITPAVLTFAAIGLYFLYILKLLYFLLVALLFWILAKRFLPGTTYGSAYKFVLYSVTLGMLLSILLDATDWFLHIYSFPFMATILATLVFLINIWTTPTVKLPLAKSSRKSSKPRKTK